MEETMEKNEVSRFLWGLIKKHGKDFTVALRYKTATNKIKKRHGRFIDLVNDEELILFSEDKGKQGRYQLARIVEIKKK